MINFGKEKKIDLKEFTLVSFLYFLIDNNYYKKDKFIKDLLISYIELYFLKKYQVIKYEKYNTINIYYNFTKKINNTNTFNLDDESLFLEFKSKLLNG